jgi:hypothetical protein
MVSRDILPGIVIAGTKVSDKLVISIFRVELIPFSIFRKYDYLEDGGRTFLRNVSIYL